MQRNGYFHLLLAVAGHPAAMPSIKPTGHHLPAGAASYGLMLMTLAVQRWPSWRQSC
jgi:hypothetical protein